MGLTQAQVCELVTYDPETGWVKWKIQREGRRFERAGSLDRNGYRRVYLAHKRVLEHRLIWLIMYGRFPVHQIDHINRIRDDNRLVNLREATCAQNRVNSVVSRNNTGFRGVTKASENRNLKKPYQATLSVNNKLVYLGMFSTVEEAANTAFQARQRIFGEFIDPALWIYK